MPTRFIAPVNQAAGFLASSFVLLISFNVV